MALRMYSSQKYQSCTPGPSSYVTSNPRFGQVVPESAIDADQTILCAASHVKFGFFWLRGQLFQPKRHNLCRCLSAGRNLRTRFHNIPGWSSGFPCILCFPPRNPKSGQRKEHTQRRRFPGFAVRSQWRRKPPMESPPMKVSSRFCDRGKERRVKSTSSLPM